MAKVYGYAESFFISARPNLLDSKSEGAQMHQPNKADLEIFFSTEELATTLRIKSTSIHRALCLQGHYLGIVPKKLPNGRLLWPKSDLNGLLEHDQETA